jgi:hypothetical protein
MLVRESFTGPSKDHLAEVNLALSKYQSLNKFYLSYFETIAKTAASTQSFRCKVKHAIADVRKHPQDLRRSGMDHGYKNADGDVMCGVVLNTSASNLNKHLLMHDALKPVFVLVSDALQSCCNISH